MKIITHGIISSNVLDQDAKNFIETANITDNNTIKWIDIFCKKTKAANLWNDFYMVKPYVGGTALAHSINLRNPSTFQSTFIGGVTHNSNGITYNGSTGYQKHGFIPSVVGVTKTDFMYSIYNPINAAGGMMFGNYVINATFAMFFSYAIDSLNSRYFSGASSPGNALPTGGLFSAFRNPTGQGNYRKGALIVQNTDTTSSNPLSTWEITEGANNNGGTIDRYAGYNNRMTIIGKYRNATQELELYNIIQEFQTGIGRAIL